jgi:hypothetical protein
MTDRSDLTDRLNDVAAAVGEDATPEFGVTIVLDAEYVDQQPEAENVVLSSNYRDSDGGRKQ